MSQLRHALVSGSFGTRWVGEIMPHDELMMRDLQFPSLISAPLLPPKILPLPDIPNHADDGFSSTALGSVIATFITLSSIDSKCPLHSWWGSPTPRTCQSVPAHIQFERYSPFLSAINTQMDL